MTDPFTPHNLHLSPDPQPLARATSEASLAVLQSPALAAFIRERIEQVEKHGFTPETDALYDEAELARGAAAYITAGLRMELGEDPGPSLDEALKIWPWQADFFKPSDYEACLIKAIAMLWAEVDRVHNARALIDAVVGPFDGQMESGPMPVFLKRTCRVCGCTENNACMTEEGPCAWAAADLCTACVGKPDPQYARKPERIEQDKANNRFNFICGTCGNTTVYSAASPPDQRARCLDPDCSRNSK